MFCFFITVCYVGRQEIRLGTVKWSVIRKDLRFCLYLIHFFVNLLFIKLDVIWFISMDLGSYFLISIFYYVRYIELVTDGREIIGPSLYPIFFHYNRVRYNRVLLYFNLIMRTIHYLVWFSTAPLCIISVYVSCLVTSDTMLFY